MQSPYSHTLLFGLLGVTTMALQLPKADLAGARSSRSFSISGDGAVEKPSNKDNHGEITSMEFLPDGRMKGGALLEAAGNTCTKPFKQKYKVHYESDWCEEGCVDDSVAVSAVGLQDGTCADADFTVKQDAVLAAVYEKKGNEVYDEAGDGPWQPQFRNGHPVTDDICNIHHHIDADTAICQAFCIGKVKYVAYAERHFNTGACPKIHYEKYLGQKVTMVFGKLDDPKPPVALAQDEDEDEEAVGNTCTQKYKAHKDWCEEGCVDADSVPESAVGLQDGTCADADFDVEEHVFAAGVYAKKSNDEYNEAADGPWQPQFNIGEVVQEDLCNIHHYIDTDKHICQVFCVGTENFVAYAEKHRAKPGACHSHGYGKYLGQKVTTAFGKPDDPMSPAALAQAEDEEAVDNTCTRKYKVHTDWCEEGCVHDTVPESAVGLQAGTCADADFDFEEDFFAAGVYAKNSNDEYNEAADGPWQLQFVDGEVVEEDACHPHHYIDTDTHICQVFCVGTENSVAYVEKHRAKPGACHSHGYGKYLGQKVTQAFGTQDDHGS